MGADYRKAMHGQKGAMQGTRTQWVPVNAAGPSLWRKP
jgi:hypothetical protein